MSDIEILSCKGCYGDFLEWDISNGYCESCNHELEAKNDNRTDSDE